MSAGESARESLDKLTKTLVDTLPEGLRSIRDELEQNFRSVLQSGLARLDLVTREEFEVQEAVLARTREKLEELERKLDTIERRTAGRKTGKPAAKKKAAKKKVKKKKG